MALRSLGLPAFPAWSASDGAASLFSAGPQQMWTISRHCWITWHRHTWVSEERPWLITLSHFLSGLVSVLPFFLQKHFVFYDTLTSGGCLGTGSTCGHGVDEQPSLSQIGVGRWKLLLFETLVKHYSRTDRPPLLPQHMAHVYTAITDLLGDYCCCITSYITHCLILNINFDLLCRGLLWPVTSRDSRHLFGCSSPVIWNKWCYLIAFYEYIFSWFYFCKSHLLGYCCAVNEKSF